MEVIKKSNLKPASSISVLVWGPTKSGKTHFAGTAGNRSLFISNGMGDETLQHSDFKNLDNFIIKVPFDELENKQRSFDLVDEAVDFGLTNAEVDTIIVDDASAQTRSGMIRALEFNASMDKSKTLSKIIASKFNDIHLTPSDYGTEMEMTAQFWAHVISDCKRASKHFILLAHERNVFKPPAKIGDQATLIKQTPAFTGADKNPDRIAGMFDWVFHTEKKQSGDTTLYQARTNGDSTCLAGVRGKGQEVFKTLENNPNFLEMLKRVRG